MYRSFFLKLLLFISTCAPSLYGFNSEAGNSGSLGTGFLVGGYATFHIFYFHTKDQTFDLFGDEIEQGLWEYDSIQRAPGGGGFIGYGISFCERFTLALKAAATGYSSEAKHSYYDDSPVLVYPNKMKVKYIVDLSLEPGAKLGNCFLLYAKFGPSYVGWRQTRQILLNELPFQVVGEDKSHFHNWGYVFGAGVDTLISRCVSAFIEFDGHSYPFNNSKRHVDNSNDASEDLDYRVTRLYGFGFRFGLSAEF
ncbi:MAG: hypothetical protein WAM28_05190 [Chlamydiales bacterium]